MNVKKVLVFTLAIKMLFVLYSYIIFNSAIFGSIESNLTPADESAEYLTDSSVNMPTVDPLPDYWYLDFQSTDTLQYTLERLQASGQLKFIINKFLDDFNMTLLMIFAYQGDGDYGNLDSITPELKLYEIPENRKIDIVTDNDSTADIVRAQLLLEYGADLNGKSGKSQYTGDTDKNTPLHFAIWNGNTNFARFLIEQGADLTALNSQGNTPLHMVSGITDRSRQIEMMKMVLEYWPNINAKNFQGVTFISMLVEQNTIEPLTFFVNEYGDFCNIGLKTRDNMDPWQLAQGIDGQGLGRCDNADEILNRIKYNASLGLGTNTNVDEKNAKGYAGIHLAAIQGNFPYMEALIDRNADISVLAPGNYTALHFAIRFGFNDCIDLLLRHNAPVNIANNRGMTPLLEILGVQSIERRTSLLKRLLEAGANINDVDLKGNNLAHLAVIKHDTEWLRRMTLLGPIFNWNARNNEGYTPLDLAKKKYYDDIVDILTLIGLGAQ